MARWRKPYVLLVNGPKPQPYSISGSHADSPNLIRYAVKMGGTAVSWSIAMMQVTSKRRGSATLLLRDIVYDHLVNLPIIVHLRHRDEVKLH